MMNLFLLIGLFYVFRPVTPQPQQRHMYWLKEPSTAPEEPEKMPDLPDEIPQGQEALRAEQTYQKFMQDSSKVFHESLKTDHYQLEPILTPVKMQGTPYDHPEFLAGGPRGFHSETSFFGIGSKGSRIAFLVNVSDAMEGYPIQILQEELYRALRSIHEDTLVSVILFSDKAIRPEHAKRPHRSSDINAEWFRLTPENRKSIHTYIYRIETAGNTDWLPPFETAFALDPLPDVIYFMTGGMLREQSPIQLTQLLEENRHQMPVINTIQVESQKRMIVHLVAPGMSPQLIDNSPFFNGADQSEFLQELSVRTGGISRYIGQSIIEAFLRLERETPEFSDSPNLTYLTTAELSVYKQLEKRRQEALMYRQQYRDVSFDVP